ncbi:MAG TPA: hypothetical protein VKB51_02885 [bacterium]|nr:hypothetical protein [bacterium]
MSLERTCFLCGKPVSIRRRMSVFCSDRCELRHRALVGEAPAEMVSRKNAKAPRAQGPMSSGNPTPWR